MSVSNTKYTQEKTFYRTAIANSNSKLVNYLKEDKNTTIYGIIKQIDLVLSEVISNKQKEASFHRLRVHRVLDSILKTITTHHKVHKL